MQKTHSQERRVGGAVANLDSIMGEGMKVGEGDENGTDREGESERGEDKASGSHSGTWLLSDMRFLRNLKALSFNGYYR